MKVVIAVYLLQICQPFSDGLELSDEAYTLNFNSAFYVCPDEVSQAFVDTSQIEINRFNMTYSYMSGVLRLLKEMNPLTSLEVVIDKEVSGSFEMFVFHEVCDLCKESNDPNSSYRDYFKTLGFSGNCPFKAKDYHMDRQVAMARDIPLNSAMVGRYQVTMNYYGGTSSDCATEKIFLGCFKFDCIVEPI